MLTPSELEMRRTGFGGSDIAAILGLSQFKRPIDVYARITGDSPIGGEPMTIPQEIGHYLEPKAAEIYARRHPEFVVDGPYSTQRVEGRPWHLYSIDRLLLSKPRQTTDVEALPDPAIVKAVLEIKTAGQRMAWEFGNDGSDDLPYAYLLQCVWYMAAVNVDHAEVAALINTNDYREYHVQRDQSLEDTVLGAAEKFWERCQRREPPSPDGSDAWSRYVSEKFAANTDVIVEKPDANEKAAALRAVKRLAKQLEKKQTILEQELQLLINDASGVQTPDGKITWKFDRQGHVATSRAMQELANRLGMSAVEYAAFCDEYRGKPPRRFLTPRAWLKDSITETKGEI